MCNFQTLNLLFTSCLRYQLSPMDVQSSHEFDFCCGCERTLCLSDKVDYKIRSFENSTIKHVEVKNVEEEVNNNTSLQVFGKFYRFISSIIEEVLSRHGRFNRKQSKILLSQFRK